MGLWYLANNIRTLPDSIDMIERPAHFFRVRIYPSYGPPRRTLPLVTDLLEDALPKIMVFSALPHLSLGRSCGPTIPWSD